MTEGEELSSSDCHVERVFIYNIEKEVDKIGPNKRASRDVYLTFSSMAAALELRKPQVAALQAPNLS